MLSKEEVLAERRAAGLTSKEEMAVEPGELPEDDGDLAVWARRLFVRPRRPHDSGAAARCAGIFTCFRSPQRRFRREVGILYDFTPLLLPQTHSSDTRERFGALYAQDLAKCDKVVAISRSTKSDAGWLTALASEDVMVSYPGPSMCVDSHAHKEPVQRRKDLILVVSTLEPRKNGRFLLDWFLNTSVLPDGVELWWVGPSGWMDCREWARGPRNAGGRLVRFLGMVSDARLCKLYQQATFTIYPSLYEGFGFPVLDSLRHGAPVACSLNSSLQEFAGPGVFPFDPCDPATLDTACLDVFERGSAGIDQVELDSRFSWDNMARTVLSLCA
jgi:glycosyltransferase involved in cell wall biosynthesis